ncbi:MAG: AAA family ATPase [Candidatus Asgardarchaeia archaeon]
MLKNIEINNFKSIKKLNLSCNRINLFIGEPNTGKSNILEAIGLVSHIYHGSIGDFIRFENLMNLFYDNDLSEEIAITLDGTQIVISFSDGYFIGQYIQKNEELFRYDYYGGGSKKIYSEFKKFKFYRFQKKISFSLKKSEYLYPPFGDNLLTILLTNKQLRSLVKRIIDNFGYKLVLKPTENKMSIQKELEDIIVEIPYHLVSETLQRIIFYLAAIYTNKKSVIAFEEPESHAFPYYTKFLAERIALDENENQYFISTHNPYFVLSLLEKTKSDEIAVNLTYLDKYQTKVRRLTHEEIERLLDLGSDLFFNLEQFLEDTA